MEKEVRRCFIKGLMRCFHGWDTQDKRSEMERMRVWIFERDAPHDFYHHLSKFAFTVYELNEMMYTMRMHHMPLDIHSMVNDYARMVSKQLVPQMILFVDDCV